jgi:hypothetical protein
LIIGIFRFILDLILCGLIAKLIHTNKFVSLVHKDLFVDVKFTPDLNSSESSDSSEQGEMLEVDSD